MNTFYTIIIGAIGSLLAAFIIYIIRKPIGNLLSFLIIFKIAIKRWFRYKKEYPNITLGRHLNYEKYRQMELAKRRNILINELEEEFPNFIKEIKKETK